MRVAAFLAVDTDDYTPKDLGHKEHRDGDDESVSTDSETGYIPRVANGNWRIDVMNKHGIGLRRQRAPSNKKPRPSAQQAIVSDSGLGSSLESADPTSADSTSADSTHSDSPSHGSSTPPISGPSSGLSSRAGPAPGALTTPTIPRRFVSSIPRPKPPGRGPNCPSASISSSRQTSISSSRQTSGVGPRPRPVAKMGLGKAPLASIRSPRKEQKGNGGHGEIGRGE